MGVGGISDRSMLRRAAVVERQRLCGCQRVCFSGVGGQLAAILGRKRQEESYRVVAAMGRAMPRVAGRRWARTARRPPCRAGRMARVNEEDMTGWMLKPRLWM